MKGKTVYLVSYLPNYADREVVVGAFSTEERATTVANKINLQPGVEECYISSLVVDQMLKMYVGEENGYS